MNDPWQILTLDRRTATERDLKAAYARMLKLHRPDADPEGFQRIRAAYSEALEWMKQKTHVAEEPDGSDDFSEQKTEHHNENTLLEPSKDTFPNDTLNSVTPEQSPETAPPEIAGCLAEIEEQVAREEPSPVALSAAFTKLSSETLRLQLPAPLVCRLLHRAVSGKADPVAQYGLADFLLYLLKGGESQIMFEVAKNWDRNRSVPSAAMFAMAVERNKFQPTDEDEALVLAHVARIVAFHHSSLGNQLANVAYPHIPRDARESIMGFLEQQISLGKLFFGFPTEMQRFWQQRLNRREEDEEVNWHSNEALDAMRYVVQNRGHSWEGLGLIQQLVPSEIWAAAEASLCRQASKAQKSQQEARGGRSSLRWVWVLVVLGANLLRMANTNSTSSTSSSHHSPPPARSSKGEDWFSKKAAQHQQVIRQGQQMSPLANPQVFPPPQIQFESKLPSSFDTKLPSLPSSQPLILPKNPQQTPLTPKSPSPQQPSLNIDPAQLLNLLNSAPKASPNSSVNIPK